MRLHTDKSIVEKIMSMEEQFDEHYIEVIDRCEKKIKQLEEKLWAFFRDNLTKKKAKTHGDYSQKNLLWLMHIMNNDHKRAKKLKPWINFERYFGNEHVFTKEIKRMYGV